MTILWQFDGKFCIDVARVGDKHRVTFTGDLDAFTAKFLRQDETDASHRTSTDEPRSEDAIGHHFDARSARTASVEDRVATSAT